MGFNFFDMFLLISCFMIPFKIIKILWGFPYKAQKQR